MAERIVKGRARVYIACAHAELQGSAAARQVIATTVIPLAPTAPDALSKDGCRPE
jgi:hypothetical protein